MQKQLSKTEKVSGAIASVLCIGMIGAIGWALHYGGMWRLPWEASGSAVTQSAPEKMTPEKVNQLKDAIAAVDPQARIIASVTNGRTEGEATVTVTNAWHTQPYQTRLQAAQSLQKIWASVYAPNQPDKARLRLVDLNGNAIGGSGWLGGTLVDVKQ